MIIKKFYANTESEAITLAKEDLGKDAVVMNVKSVSPKGILKLFKKKQVEVTAALDENITYQPKETVRPAPAERSHPAHIDLIADDDDDSQAQASHLEKKLDDLKSMMEKQMAAKEEAKRQAPQEASGRDQAAEEDGAEDSNISYIRLIYNQLVDNEVDEKYANQVISEIEGGLKKDSSLDNILSAVYQKIVLKLGKTELLEIKPGKTKYVFFIGPTGVGKTTTIAKLASTLKVKKKVNVALLTADTYRIAAVDQLKTYADIMGTPLKVVYSHTEMKQAAEDFKGHDIVLIDTAGRSHRSKEQRDDLEKLIAAIPKEEREIYLVLS
ncbi:MAG: flagellar biosynthesis protein FlhF, partial [Lachnospiraceae bacterium]|nr:flagellar biosynthesis protein FlhF [Lachnospiraceae bacterium]